MGWNFLSKNKQTDPPWTTCKLFETVKKGFMSSLSSYPCMLTMNSTVTFLVFDPFFSVPNFKGGYFLIIITSRLDDKYPLSLHTGTHLYVYAYVWQGQQAHTSTMVTVVLFCPVFVTMCLSITVSICLCVWKKGRKTKVLYFPHLAYPTPCRYRLITMDSEEMYNPKRISN